jgi:hypothetical protein
MPVTSLSVDEIMAILPATVPQLADLTRDLTIDQLHRPPELGSWSVNDVLAHLRACNDVLGRAARRIDEEDHPAWRAMSPRTWQRRSGYHDWSFPEAFAAFRKERAELLDILGPLDGEAWQRTATVTVPPKAIYERSVQYYGDWLASHERTHARGLPSIIARASMT